MPDLSLQLWVRCYKGCTARRQSGQRIHSIVGEKMRIARVFPRRTRATPTDDLSFVGTPGLFPPEVDEVHISVAFSWDLALAEQLEKQWKPVAPVQIGGPATGQPSGEFDPGMYIKQGYVITSRGCPNRCWFCEVWKREHGEMKELRINDGWNILDDNLLACSDRHITSVFSMLERQANTVEFTGGLEAARLKDWHIDWLVRIKDRKVKTDPSSKRVGAHVPMQIFFAYDTPDDYEPLVSAAQRLISAGFKPESHMLRCYLLVGFPKDTFDSAELRMKQVIDLGVYPNAMLWRGRTGLPDPKWISFQSKWGRAIRVFQNIRINTQESIPPQMELFT